MAAKTTAKKTTKRPSSRPPRISANGANGEMNVELSPTREQIAQRAFELFLARGGEHGRHEEDWLRAEREIRERHGLS
jgi:hypothetical protein